MLPLFPLVAVLALINQSAIRLPGNDNPATAPLPGEDLRPRFHFTAPRGWLNDPNGLVYYAGEYHLFYQHNPQGTNWVNDLSWGHAIGKDLLHWQHLPDVLPPLAIPGKSIRAGSWSGSALVDWSNSAGFQSGPEKPIVLAWTATGLGQCLAYSNDRGRTFTPYAQNPVLPQKPPRAGDWDRDPKIYWHAPSQRWTMALSISGEGVRFYSSPDLKAWTYESTMPDLWECPDYYELAVEGKPGHRKWVIQDASGKYFLGRFDGKCFERESGPFRLDYGRNYYAAQTWNDVPAADGRRIGIAWMRDGKFPGMPFNQQMGIPSVLSLRTLPEGLRLTKLPVRELEALRREKKSWAPGVIDRSFDLGAFHADAFDLLFIFQPGDAGEVSLQVGKDRLLLKNGVFSYGESSMPLAPMAGRIELRLLVDRTSLEVYANAGAASMTCARLSQGDARVSISAAGGSIKVLSLYAYPLRSVW
jgi:fructan beta-fructosidase